MLVAVCRPTEVTIEGEPASQDNRNLLTVLPVQTATCDKVCADERSPTKFQPSQILPEVLKSNSIVFQADNSSTTRFQAPIILERTNHGA
jgi:hypothetical protein